MTEEGLSGIGARLRLAREQAGLSLRQIADRTKLTVRTLDALERERIVTLPSGLYRRAIVRAYAREIGLNPEIILREFLAQYPDDLPPLPPLPTRKPTAYDLPPEPEPPSPPRTLRRMFGLSSLFVPIGAGVFYFTIGIGGADTPRRIATTAAAPPQYQMVQARSIDGPIDGPRPTVRALAMMITVTSRCDLQVIADGGEVIARAVEPGERVLVDVSEDVVLVGSNAGAVHLSINGRVGRALGGNGSPLNVRIGRGDYDAWLAQ